MMERATPEEIQRIDAALEAVKGHRGHAAIALGVEPKRLYDLVSKNEYLRAKWVTNESTQTPVQPGLASEIHREAPLAPFGIDHAAVAGLDAQDAMLEKKGPKLAGFARKEQKFIGELMTSYSGSIRTAMDLTHSGAVYATGRLALLLKNLTEKLEHIEENPDEYELVAYTKTGDRYVTKSAHEYYRETADLIAKISGELRKMNATVHQTNEMRLRAKKLEMSNNQKVVSVAAWESPVKMTEGEK
jgi:hypothetical protein